MKKIILVLFIIFTLVACKQSADKVSGGIVSEVEKYCDGENSVEVCGDYIKVISPLLGGGATFYSKGSEVQCPVVGPDSMTDECKELLFEMECKGICSVEKLSGQELSEEEEGELLNKEIIPAEVPSGKKS